MKKKLLLAVLPLLALVSCGKSSGYGMSSRTVDAAPEVATVRETYRGAPVIRSSSNPDSKHVTFLMLSANAYLLDGELKVEGKDVPELYLEHTVAWFAEPGTELPVAPLEELPPALVPSKIALSCNSSFTGTVGQ